MCTLICVTYWNCKSVLYCCINYRASSNCEIITLFFVQYGIIAERLSARLLIVQCGQLAFVCIYVCIYICMCIYIYISITLLIVWVQFLWSHPQTTRHVVLI